MKQIITILSFSFFFISLGAKSPEKIELLSPDGKNNITITTGETLQWSVKRNSKSLITESPITMTVGSDIWGTKMKKYRVESKSFNGSVKEIVARKFSVVEENYNSTTIVCRSYSVEFRAYNDGVAYRFISNSNTEEAVKDETVKFNLAENFKTYTLLTNKLQNWYEELYSIMPVEELSDTLFSINPVMIDAEHCKLLLADANLVNYPGLYLRPEGRSFTGVLAKYPTEETIINGGNKKYATKRADYLVPDCGKRSFPWRVVGIFDNDIDILESELIYLLSDKSDPKTDYSWIKPGKVLWDWWNGRNIYKVNFKSGVNTPSYMYLIDFAAKHNIEYLLIDEGWSDRNDLTKLNPEVDMPSICKYANSKNVGIILWTKWINLDNQMDIALDMMESWGVKGIKIDFMDRNDAIMVNFFHRSVKKAAEHKMLVDYHGSYPGKGERRIYPNMMTREGVIGLEYNKFGDKLPSPEHDLTIPFIRMWAGPMDYTPGAMLNAQEDCYFKTHKEPMSMGTRCHQLAMYIVYESPLQMVSDSPTKYNENPECLDFISKVPSTWDYTLPIDGKISDYLVLARKKDNKWYIGAMNDNTSRNLNIGLEFLEDGEWNLEIFKDGINADINGKDYTKNYQTVNNTDNLSFHMAKGGGFVVIITRKAD